MHACIHTTEGHYITPQLCFWCFRCVEHVVEDTLSSQIKLKCVLRVRIINKNGFENEK